MSRDTSSTPKFPQQRTGLYDPALEHDACGLALIVRYRGEPDHEVVEQALSALRKLEHRGGIASDEARATVRASPCRSRTTTSPRCLPPTAWSCRRPASTPSASASSPRTTAVTSPAER